MAGIWTSDVLSMILRLFVAMLLATVFGWERERKNRAAGLRTHILVCVGASLITMISESYAKPGDPLHGSDPTRISAQIVSGIGFLGAGTILVRGGSIRGLTTAASLWVSAAIGMAVGRGGEFFVVAAATSLIVLFVLTVVDYLEDRVIKRRLWREVTVCYRVGEGSDKDVVSLLNEMKVELRSVERQEAVDSHTHLTAFIVQLPPGLKRHEVDARLLSLPWLQRIEWE